MSSSDEKRFYFKRSSPADSWSGVRVEGESSTILMLHHSELLHLSIDSSLTGKINCFPAVLTDGASSGVWLWNTIRWKGTKEFRYYITVYTGCLGELFLSMFFFLFLCLLAFKSSSLQSDYIRGNSGKWITVSYSLVTDLISVITCTYLMLHH